MNENKQINIACVGMTHLGLVHAAAFAEKGFNLICYDENRELIDTLQRHQLPVNEPELDSLVQKNQDHLTFTDDIKQLHQCSVVFIAYDVPTDDEGNSDLTVIDRLLEKVQPALSKKATLVLLSQVPPGFTRRIDLSKHRLLVTSPSAPSSRPHDLFAGLTAGSTDLETSVDPMVKPQEREDGYIERPGQLRLFYQVETLIFGSAVARALYPERYIVGAHNPHQPLPKDYAKLLNSFACPILTMQYESAELAKISINLFLVASVTTTNTIAEICEHIGADWEDIAPTLKLDKRIGPHAYLKPGLGIAGGNLERDLNTIVKLGQQHQTDIGVVKSWLKNSTHRRDWVYRCLQNQVLNHLKHPKICILGLAYKPNTHSIKNSPSIALIQQLKDYEIQAHDPIVKGAGLTHAKQQSDLFQAIKEADVVIIMLPCAEYQALTIEQIMSLMRGNIIIDPYRVLSRPSMQEHAIHYHTLGQCAIQINEREVDYA